LRCVGLLLALALKRNRAPYVTWLCWLIGEIPYSFSLLVSIGSQLNGEPFRPSGASVVWRNHQVSLPFAIAVPVSQVITLPESATIPLALAVCVLRFRYQRPVLVPVLA